MLELVPFDINCDNRCGRVVSYSLKDGDKRIGDYCSLCADSVLKSEQIRTASDAAERILEFRVK